MLKKTEIIRRLRKDYSYTLKRLHRDFGIHPQTTRGYIKDKDNPLMIISKNPTLIFSETLRIYLRKQVEQRKVKLGAYEFYCMGCKQKHTAFRNNVAEKQINKNIIMHKAICPKCFSIMNKFQSSKRLKEVIPLFEIISLENLYILQNENSDINTHNNKKGKEGQNDKNNNYQQGILFKEGSK